MSKHDGYRKVSEEYGSDSYEIKKEDRKSWVVDSELDVSDGLRSGLYRDKVTWDMKQCNDPSHNPPSHIHIPNGSHYRHYCSGCGRLSILRSNRVTL